MINYKCIVFYHSPFVPYTELDISATHASCDHICFSHDQNYVPDAPGSIVSTTLTSLAIVSQCTMILENSMY